MSRKEFIASTAADLLGKCFIEKGHVESGFGTNDRRRQINSGQIGAVVSVAIDLANILEQHNEAPWKD